jgi:hypothetical protein
MTADPERSTAAGVGLSTAEIPSSRCFAGRLVCQHTCPGPISRSVAPSPAPLRTRDWGAQWEWPAVNIDEPSYGARKRPLESDLPEQIEVRVRRERAERQHGDGTTAPMLAKGKRSPGRSGHTFATSRHCAAMRSTISRSVDWQRGRCPGCPGRRNAQPCRLGPGQRGRCGRKTRSLMPQPERDAA